LIGEDQPKASRQRLRGHDQAVKPSKRQYAVQDNQVEHVQVGAAEDLSASIISPTLCYQLLIQFSQASQILDLMSSESSDQTRNVMSKKAKQTLKHDLFLESGYKLLRLHSRFNHSIIYKDWNPHDHPIPNPMRED
jgi:hypothetical protein